jgi:hypothetical protein
LLAKKSWAALPFGMVITKDFRLAVRLRQQDQQYWKRLTGYAISLP